ncbi:cytochrome b/b6 domain-containing protein [Pseudophaeobacter sp.]|uniref:cytochrome b/b6 domain-containing protein n=1 Tax=Pseudophaeobacter sp. TaxID=1971739 RepID=UPI003297C4B0
MARFPVWDPFIRLFHWSLVLLFAANSFVIDPDSALHAPIGYAIVALIALRLVWGLIGSPYARFSSFPISQSAILSQIRDIALSRRAAHCGHSPLGSVMICNLLFCILALGGSGYLASLSGGAVFPWAEDLHEFLVAWVQFSIVIHIGAVFFESRRIGVDLIRAMMTGFKEIPRYRAKE